jgi:ketosteroid isomerase-like protein
MRAIIGALSVAVCLAGSAYAAGPDSGPAATVHQFIDDFNKGDIAGAKATHLDDVSIVDEVAPHEWHGPGAFDAWVAALSATATATGQTKEQVVIGDNIRTQIDGDTAYVVMAAVFTYDLKGTPTVEPAQMVFALRNGAGGWKISGWAWSGAVPQPKAH